MIRAIVIDDDKETVLLFKELLQNNNIEVVGTGYNGQDATYLYQKLKPDIVYLDVVMPVYDGTYALKKIREINENATVVMTANKITLSHEMALNKLKPSAIINEPIDVDEIIKTTHKLCAPTSDSQQNMQKTMVILALKNTLLELGVQEYDKVIGLLQKDFNAGLDDCYENPHYLRQILQDLFGNSYQDILSSLNENMKEISNQREIKDFLQTLNI